jgi:ketosteroid isomerase-like protein
MKTMEREVMSRHVFDSGDSATVVTHSRVHGMYKEQDIDLSRTETLVMKKIGGQWKIVHIHSTPKCRPARLLLRQASN